jgi:hypothetical protein
MQGQITHDQLVTLASPPTSSSPDDEPDSIVDLCGEICPYTFVRTKLGLEGALDARALTGQVLTMLYF